MGVFIYFYALYIYKFSFLHSPGSVTIKPLAFKASIAVSGEYVHVDRLLL